MILKSLKCQRRRTTMTTSGHEFDRRGERGRRAAAADKVAPDEAHDEERSLLCPTMRRRRDKKNTHERNKQNKQNKNKQKTNKNKTNEQRKKQRNRKKGRESVKTTNQKNKKIKNIKCSPRFPVEGNHVTQYTQFLIILFHYTQQQQKKETHYSVPSIHKSNL